MSNFKQTLNELYLTGYFADKWEARKLASQYDKSTPEKKAALDKHAIMVLEKQASHNMNFRANVTSIKNNLQFIAWLLIIGAVFAVIAAVIAGLAS